jgi:hypothetical protein
MDAQNSDFEALLELIELGYCQFQILW